MEKPILFNTEMVKAILEDRKTTTRRIIKRTPSNDEPSGYGFWKSYEKRDGKGYIKDYTHSPCWWTLEEYISKFSKYHVGDILYVRETWTRLYEVDANGYTHWDKETIYYAADGCPDLELRDADGFLEKDQRIKWKPSIHMPRKLARIFLKVTNVRVERLQDITEKEIKREGIKEEFPPLAQDKFRDLWDSTLKKEQLEMYGWSANPYVWVIEFEKIEK